MLSTRLNVSDKVCGAALQTALALTAAARFTTTAVAADALATCAIRNW